MKPFWRLSMLMLMRLPLLVALLGGLSASTTAVAAVEASFHDLDGKTVRVADYRGRWLLVNFWAPWCPLCKAQVPMLNTLAETPGFAVLGVAMDHGGDVRGLRAAADKYDMRFTVAVGGSRRNLQGPERAIGPVDFFPTSYLIDPNGEVMLFLPGQARIGQITAAMERWQATHGKGAEGFDWPRLAAVLNQRHGSAGGKRYQAWRAAMQPLLRLAERERLDAVNAWFNRHISASAPATSGWATLADTLQRGSADATGLALAKYFSLLALQVPTDRLRLVFTDDDSRSGRVVLAWYATPQAEPLLLDREPDTAVPASQRSDLRPLYSLDARDAQSARTARPGTELPAWLAVLTRARAEGFD